MPDPQSPSRPRRDRRTRRSVVLAERFARAAITAGGVGTILAVALIFVFLAWVVLPLFASPQVLADEEFAAPGVAEAPLHLGVDEDRLLAWTLHRDGSLELHDLTTGERLDLRRPFGDAVPASASFSVGGDDVVFGFEDGTVRAGRLGFESHFLEEDAISEAVRGLKIGASAVYEGGVVARTTIGQLRLTTLVVELDEPLDTENPSPVVLVDHAVTPAGLTLATLQANGALRVSRERERRNLMTGKVTKSLRQAELAPAGEGEAQERPAGLLMGGLGQHLYVVHTDGRTVHWDLRDFSQPRVSEEVDLAPRDGGAVASVDFVAGRETLVVGSTAGAVETWFSARQNEEADPLLVRVHELPPGGSAALAIAASPRSRLIAVSFASGAVRLYQASLGRELLVLGGEEAAQVLVIPPKEDAVVARSTRRFTTWEVDTKYPEASLAALFRPVWYEGYAKPSHVWQSSSASDDFEPKLGLAPLVFGTIKATLYSLLFGAPLAILAALYTSEFMAARLRSTVKSTVELMASLPSVVLGFIAALVLAPFVQSVLPAVMAAFLTVPLATLLGAHLWQMLPNHVAVRWGGWQRFTAILLTLPIGVAGAMVLGPLLEGVVFAGDMAAWLDGQRGSAFGGWFFLLLPLAALATALLSAVVVSPRLRSRSQAWERRQVAQGEALKFVGAVVVTAALAALAAVVLQGIGLDPRGGVVDTYVQRNALIVGFAMGFAIVPIIYTLAEDALSEVPAALREGSLGAGATPWQTTVRIVIPFAMSGIFSALMIGLGRAVGETMIVLMAAGNTPIMDWNVFNGFRTLSANIAVELPEAVVGSAHYRTLFLAALVLFALTFALNTFAELVRRRFRRRFQGL